VNADQSDLDLDGEGDACDLDDDADGVADTTDNCPLYANSTQSDFDADGFGDVCDGDDDADGVGDDVDACEGTPIGSLSTITAALANSGSSSPAACLARPLAGTTSPASCARARRRNGWGCSRGRSERS
jgi:hypothetical protein